MSYMKRIPLPVLALLLIFLGLAAVTAGIYDEFGRAWALMFGGTAAAAVGVLVDVD